MANLGSGAIGSISAPNLEASPVYAFTSSVDNAMASMGGYFETSHPPAHAFTSSVDNAMASMGGHLETSHPPVHAFTSSVDNAMASMGGHLETSHPPAHAFTLSVDNAMASMGGHLETSHPPVHAFASSVDNAMSSIGGYLRASHYLLNVHGFQLFRLAELVAATNNFSCDNMIGAGSIGVVYRGKLVGGREVAIKRVETGSDMKEFQENGCLMALLPGVHHKHLVRLVGICKEKNERLFVSEYMKNGTLYDHLHAKDSSVLNSWIMRIKFALDASRGIEYIHNYAAPYIHTDIKSSNILLDATCIHRDLESSDILLADATWTAKVSDFGPSFMKKTAGTVGYIDPDLNALTAKSDVYGLGVVLLELLTGKTPILSGEDGGTPLSVVDFAVPTILAGDLVKILDPKVGPPDVNEAVAVKLVAHTAIHCVNLERKDRPTMADIVVNLKSALAICRRSSHDSPSSGTILVLLPTKKKKKNYCCF